MKEKEKSGLSGPAPATKQGLTRCNSARYTEILCSTAPKMRLSLPDQENQKGEKKMPKIFVDFRPAEVSNKKETYVFYYVVNPYTGKLVRKRIRCNHVGNKTARLKYARLIAQAINERLFMGWNPFHEELPNTAVSIKDAIARFVAEKEKTLRERSVETYRSFAYMFSDWLDMRGLANAYAVTIDKNVVMQYLEWLDRTKHLSNRSYNNYILSLSTLFDWLKQKGYCAEIPTTGIPRRKVDRKTRVTIPKCDRELIRAYFNENCPRYYWVMQLCYRLFIRPNEICGLRFCNLDLKNKVLKIPSVLAKNHCDRVLGLPDDILCYFQSLTDYPDSWFIFADPHTYVPGPKAIAPTRIAETWKSMRDKLKLPASYQFYSLKDTGITEMLEAGVPAKYVKELADHHSLEMTERYTHRSDAMKILEWNRLEF